MLYSVLSDAYAGLAGQSKEDAKQRDQHLSTTLVYLNRAKEGMSLLDAFITC